MQIAKHLEYVMTTVPNGVQVIYGRADCGFYCWEAIEGLPDIRLPVHRGRAKNTAIIERAESGALEAVSAHRCRPAVRILDKRKGGAGRIGSSPCAMSRNQTPKRRKRSNTSCSRPRRV